jgi:serine/threonine protein phosphatase PrpC
MIETGLDTNNSTRQERLGASETGWSGAAQTHRGKRRQHNEDAVLARSDVGLWVVADGMGGHALGDFASQSIRDALVELSVSGTLADCVDCVEAEILDVNDALRAHARVHCDGATIGSTVIALVADQQVGVALWAGDSRLYRYRLGRLEQVTRDHNPAFELFETGAMSEAELLATDSNIITRAVGSQQELHLDVAVFEVDPYDTFLLCSDGLYREVSLEDMHQCLSGDSPQTMADDLLALALASPARDNVSIVVAHLGSVATNP